MNLTEKKRSFLELLKTDHVHTRITRDEFIEIYIEWLLKKCKNLEL